MLRWLFSAMSAVVLTLTLIYLEDTFVNYRAKVFFAHESCFETRI